MSSLAPAFDRDQTILLTALIKDKDGTAFDPGTVTFKIRGPKGIVSVTPTKGDAGSYTYEYDPLAAGAHWWRVKGTGGGNVGNEAKFIVNASAFPPE